MLLQFKFHCHSGYCSLQHVKHVRPQEPVLTLYFQIKLSLFSLFAPSFRTLLTDSACSSKVAKFRASVPSLRRYFIPKTMDDLAYLHVTNFNQQKCQIRWKYTVSVDHSRIRPQVSNNLIKHPVVPPHFTTHRSFLYFCRPTPKSTSKRLRRLIFL